MKKKIIIFVLVIILATIILAQIGLLNEGINVFLGEIPILGDILFFMDTCKFVIILGNEGIVENSVFVLSYLISLLVSVYVLEYTKGIDGIYNILLSFIIAFFFTIVLKKFYIEVILNFVENFSKHINQLLLN